MLTIIYIQTEAPKPQKYLSQKKKKIVWSIAYFIM